jgi:hypothetical protein
MGRLEWNRAVERDRDVLERILALLLALAALADRAAGLPAAKRLHVLAILGRGEAEARMLIIEMALGAPAEAAAPPAAAGDAGRLAASFRVLALALGALLAQARAPSQPVSPSISQTGRKPRQPAQSTPSPSRASPDPPLPLPGGEDTQFRRRCSPCERRKAPGSDWRILSPGQGERWHAKRDGEGVLSEAPDLDRNSIAIAQLNGRALSSTPRPRFGAPARLRAVAKLFEFAAMPTVAPLDLEGHCVAAVFLGGVPHFALASGTIHRLDHGHKSAEAHDGLLCAAATPDGARLISGGEDGKVVATGLAGQVEILAELGRKWITSVAAGPQGAVAFASGRTAYVRLADGKRREFAHPRSVEGIAFAPKGMRIGVARYNGATLHFPAAEGKPVELEWAGAHTGITFSPDGNFVVTTMQENALHGWKLSDGKHMRMSGYPAKVKSFSWSPKGRWLATSGAPAAIVWPFQGKDGPMGKAPLELGTRGNMLVTCVACHPTDEIAAIGYADGMVLAARFSDQKEILLRRPGKGAITSMMWDAAGGRLAFGSEAGDCGVIDITA